MQGEKKSGRSQMDMLNGPLLKKILMFALPLAASSVLQQLFNSADVAVVGRFAGSQAQAAVGCNGSVVNLLVNLLTGFTVGVNAVIATYIGQRDEKKIRDAVHTVMVLGLVCGTVFFIIGETAAYPILTIMNTPADVIDAAVLYLRIYYIGMPAIVLYNFTSAILRSKGDTKRPMYALTFSGVVNVILNLILVVAFHMGVAGVAIATTTSNVLSAFLVVYWLTKEEEPYRFSPKCMMMDRIALRRILQIGVPAAVQGVVFPISNMCIQTAINGFGAQAIAGSEVALNFERFTYFVISAFAATAVTFTSQNFGAGKHDRCRRSFWICMCSSILLSSIMTTTFTTGKEFLVRIYTVDPVAMEFAMIRLVHVLTLECMPTLYEVPSSALRGMGYSVMPAIITIVGTCLFRIGWVYTVFAWKGTFSSVLDVYPFSWALTGTAMLIVYFIISGRYLKGQKKKVHVW